MYRYTDVTLSIVALRDVGQHVASTRGNLNVRQMPAIEVGSSFEVYTFTLDTREAPNPYLDPAHIQLDIQSSTIERGPGNFQGVAVDSIELVPNRDLRDVLMLTIAW